MGGVKTNKFEVGNLVRSVEYFPLMMGALTIKEINTDYTPTLYHCTDMVGNQYTFYEEELETQYQHDKRFGLLNKC
ncbi:MAG: hypothetical protein DRO67_00080 [Candidatus Asgardarchaeum californiense]|nr:MAG: hypothetical protein DRO67_00080 [Candidatus Asgardarchaeum californiense]